MTSLIRRLLSLSVLIAFVVPGMVAAQQAPKEVKGAKHGDWQIICFEGTELCRMEQFGKDSTSEPALKVGLQRVKGVKANNKDVPAVISMLAPLGVLLPFNLRAKIDNGEIKLLPFERCLPLGCLAAGPMNNETVDAMKRGSKMTVEFVFERKENITVSLRGFTKAYNSLKPIPAKQGR